MKYWQSVVIRLLAHGAAGCADFAAHALMMERNILPYRECLMLMVRLGCTWVLGGWLLLTLLSDDLPSRCRPVNHEENTH